MTREEELRKQQQQQQGIGTAAYHEPAGSIGTAAQNQGIGAPAYHEPAGSIGTPASRDGTMKPVDPKRGTNQQQPIQVMQGVQPGTQQKLNGLEQGYNPNAQTQAAQEALQQLIAQKPQGYTSKYSGQLEGILQELQGKKFNYDLNGDAFFQSLKDTQVQLAKQASQDVMGQAAGLTGGYGNSYATGAAQQSYQQGLLNLNDRAMDAYGLALQRFQMEQQGLKDRFGMLSQREADEYGMYRDTVSDFNNERDYLTRRYDTEAEADRDQYNRDLNYYLERAKIENADYRDEQERQEAIRQFELNYAMDQDRLNWQKDTDQRDYDRNVLESDRNYTENVRQYDTSLDWDKKSAEQKYNMQLALAILENGQMPSADMLAAAGISEEDAQKLMAQLAPTGGGGGGKKAPTYYVDIAGNYYTTDSKGNYIPVKPGDVDPNGREDTSKMMDITGRNLANTWTTASQAQADIRAAENAALAQQRQIQDQQSRENQEKLRQILSGYKGFNLFH